MRRLCEVSDFALAMFNVADINKHLKMNGASFREGYVIRDQFATHYLTFTVCGWIDLFTRKVYRDIVMESFRFAQLYS